ncbi:hypothetical protein AB5I41_30345 [Sphingomonas sp. MMS24-JH45]
MRVRSLAFLLPLAALSACATGPQSFPVQATRFHYDAVAGRGSVAVEPLAGGAPASIEYKTYAAAVQAELLRLGFTNPAPGTRAQYIATVGFTRASRALPPAVPPCRSGSAAASARAAFVAARRSAAASASRSAATAPAKAW